MRSASELAERMREGGGGGRPWLDEWKDKREWRDGDGKGDRAVKGRRSIGLKISGTPQISLCTLFFHSVISLSLAGIALREK